MHVQRARQGDPPRRALGGLRPPGARGRARRRRHRRGARRARGVLRVPAWSCVVDPVDSGADGDRSARAYARDSRARSACGAGPVDLVASRSPCRRARGSARRRRWRSRSARALGARTGSTPRGRRRGDGVGDGLPRQAERARPHGRRCAGGFGLFTRAGGLAPLRAAPRSRSSSGTPARRATPRAAWRASPSCSTSAATRCARASPPSQSLVERGADAVARGAYGELGAAMNENQRHLEALEVSCPEIERMCAHRARRGRLRRQAHRRRRRRLRHRASAPARAAVRDAWRSAPASTTFVTRRSEPAMRARRATPNTNIALVKYWGKRDAALNLPAVGSPVAHARRADDAHRGRASTASSTRDTLQLNGAPADERAARPHRKFLDLVRARAGARASARSVESATTSRRRRAWPRRPRRSRRWPWRRRARPGLTLDATRAVDPGAARLGLGGALDLRRLRRDAPRRRAPTATDCVRRASRGTECGTCAWSSPSTSRGPEGDAVHRRHAATPPRPRRTTLRG